MEQAEGREVKDAGATEPVAAQWGGVGVMVEEWVGYPGVVAGEGAGERVGAIPLAEGVWEGSWGVRDTPNEGLTATLTVPPTAVPVGPPSTT